VATGAAVVAASGPSPALDVALDLTAPPAEGLYVHVPFCVSICPYCDFVVYGGAAARGAGSRIADLVGALTQELELRADLIESQPQPEKTAKPPPLGSVYFGGGTPSLLTAAQLERFLSRVDARLGLASDAEITLEANPGVDEIGDLRGFRAAGVTRLSIGAQSMDRAELRRLGRRHTPADVVAASRAAREAGFASLSLDLLTDTPGQSLASWQSTLRQVLELDPDHLSVYALSLDDPEDEGLTGLDGDHRPVSAGARRWRERSRPLQSQDRAAQMETLTDQMTTAAGLQRYEISNLARPGHRSRHNLLYWQRRPYLALGPGAHASDGRLRRSWNAARLDGYGAALSEGRLPPGGAETVDASTAIAESAMLGLRLSDGIEPGLAQDARVAPALDWARTRGLAMTRGGRVRLTAKGRLLANEVFMRLLPDVTAAGAGRLAARSTRST